jgi:hypothetical protein
MGLATVNGLESSRKNIVENRFRAPRLSEPGELPLGWLIFVQPPECSVHDQSLHDFHEFAGIAR